jgi:UDPglucose 6-dehydrogenase
MEIKKNYERIGFIGLGKLGLPCAAAMQVKTGKKLVGYDINPEVADYLAQAKVPYMEAEIEHYLEKAKIEFASSIEQVVASSDVIFIAVQTPHDPLFEGVTEVPEETADFDYSYLTSSVEAVAEALVKFPEESVDIVVISTVLPGTMRRTIIPILEPLGQRVTFFYNPYFIAMGSTIPDFLTPEFTLVGTDVDAKTSAPLVSLYEDIHDAEVRLMKVESAELTKVAYNTFIGFKIVFSNYIGEITDATGGDSDEVLSALTQATDRLFSGKYLSAGMADGGGCHPRDQIAMSHLAMRENLSADPSGWIAQARDAQTRRQRDIILQNSERYKLPVCLMGLAYKKDVNLTIGSPALLLRSMLEKMGVSVDSFDPIVDPSKNFPEDPKVFFISTNHSFFKQVIFPSGSVVIDPWGSATTADSQSDVVLIRPGRSD